jgi:Na+/H+ antiporter NhaC
LLLPILLVGLIIGGAAKYFMTRAAPLLIRQAFTTATLFSAFSYGENIEKVLGGFITGFLVMALVFRFVYPIIARWMAGSFPSRRLVSQGAFRDMPT